MTIHYYALSLAILYCASIEAQSNLLLNPSFEGVSPPGWNPNVEIDVDGRNISVQRIPEFHLPHWKNTGKYGESPPDVFSSNHKQWSIEGGPYDASNFVSIVTRPSGTTESISQKLMTPLLPGNLYLFTVWARQSPVFISPLGPDLQPTSFVNPTRIRVGGRKALGSKMFVLSQSDPINNTDWEEFLLFLKPTEKYNYLTIEAFFEDEDRPLPGHILIDACYLNLLPKGD